MFYLMGNNEASIKKAPVTIAKTAARMYITKSVTNIGYLHVLHPIIPALSFQFPSHNFCLAMIKMSKIRYLHEIIPFNLTERRGERELELLEMGTVSAALI